MMRKKLVLFLSAALLATSVSPCVFAEEAESDLLVPDEFLIDEVETNLPDAQPSNSDEQSDSVDSEIVDNEPEKVDTEEEDQSVIGKEAKILNALGILEYENSLAVVTRAEFVAAVANLCGYDGGVYNISGRFSDVTEEHQLVNQIAFAADIQLVAGSNGCFRPDDAISQEEIAIVTLRALGYDSFSPHIQMDTIKARREGIFRGVKLKRDGTINFDNAAKVIYNTMNLPMILIRGTSADALGNPSLILDKTDTTALNYYKDIYMHEGIVTDNGITTFVDNTNIGSNSIKVGDDVFQRGSFAANEVLGHTLEVYYNEDNEILFANDITEDRDILYIPAKDIISATMGSIHYVDKNGRSKSLSFSTTAKLIYNGKAVKAGEYKDELLKPGIGGIELIRTTGSDYDLVNITSMFNCVVNKISDTSGVYTFIDVDDTDRNVVIDIDDIGSSVWITDENGIVVDCSGISYFNVLSVAQSLDKEYLYIKVSDTSKKGVIEQISSGTPMKFTVNGEEYTLSSGAASEDIKINVFGWFYFDIYGDVAYFKSFAAYEHRFGYLLSARLIDDGNDMVFRAKIFDASGQMLQCSAVKHLMVDGINYKNSGFGSVVEAFYEGAEFKPCRIRYELDLDGNIKSIDTCTVGNETEDSLRELTAPKNQESVNSGIFVGKRRYYKTSTQFDGQLFINDDTQIFGIPVGDHDDDDYQMLNINYFVNSRYYDVELYTDDSTSDIAKAAIVRYAAKYDENNVNSKNYVIMPSVYPSMMDTGLVEDVMVSLDRNGDVVKQVVILRLHENKRYTYTIRWQDLEDEFVAGNIVRYYVVNDRIIDAEMVFNLDTCDVGAPRKLSPTIDTFVVRQNNRDLADSSTTYEKTPLVSAAWSLACLDVLSTNGGILKGVTGDADVAWPEEHVDRVMTKNVGFVYNYNTRSNVASISDFENIRGYDTHGDASKVVILYNSARPLAVIVIDE